MKEDKIADDEKSSKGASLAQVSKSVMTKFDQAIIFTGLLLVSWSMTWEKSIVVTLTPSVTSLFQTNNISAILSTVLSIVQTALQPIYSKLSDIIGRAQVYTLSIVLFAVSYIIMATAQSYNTLIGGQVVYAFGYSGTWVLGPILIGDMTNLVNRSIYLALYNFPTIINMFAASAAAQAILNHGHWRWGYGHISIVVFAAGLPLIFGLWRVQIKANKIISQQQTIIKPKKSIVSRICWFFNRIDIVGSILLVAGLFLILLPLILARTWGGWGQRKTIGTLVAGGVAWILFIIWEWKLAPLPIIPLTNWESKNPIWGVLMTSLINVINFMMDYQYFLTYLEVTRRLDSKTAIYLERGFNVTYVCVPLLLGYLMKQTKRWRPFIWVGAICSVLGPGLMIPARRVTSPDVFIVISQIVFGFAPAFSNYPVLIGIQGSVPKKDIAIVIALYEVGNAVSTSIGTSIAGSVWNSVLPNLFKKYVPGEYDYNKIVGNIQYAKSLPEDQYKGIVKAYDEAMHTLGIVAVCIGAVAFLTSLFLKGFSLDDDTEDTSVANRDEENIKEIIQTPTKEADK